jgi:UDPglucose--hexose-1-phosphate uridylyltransferase
MIIPRSHDLHLTDSNDQTLAAVGLAIRDAIRHLRQAVGDVSYNLVLRTAPHHYSGAFHWHVNILPKLHTTAGFERGTGVLINIVPPESAAEQMRNIAVHA